MEILFLCFPQTTKEKSESGVNLSLYFYIFLSTFDIPYFSLRMSNRSIRLLILTRSNVIKIKSTSWFSRTFVKEQPEIRKYPVSLQSQPASMEHGDIDLTKLATSRCNGPNHREIVTPSSV